MTPDHKTPLRVTWTVPEEEGRARFFLERLIEGRVLFIEAEVTPSSALALAGALRGPLKGARLSVTGEADALGVFASSAAAADADGALLPPYPEEGRISKLAGSYKSLAVALRSTGEGMASFGEALKLAAKSGLRIAALNPHAPAMPIGRDIVMRAARLHEEAGRPAMTAHDLFLADALGLNPWKNYHGCAAGATLAHLDTEGELRLCRTLPAFIGDLKTSTLKELWNSPVRAAFRSSLAEPPLPCRGCAVEASCGGGCPGLADETRRDASCPGQRKFGK